MDKGDFQISKLLPPELVDSGRGAGKEWWC